jgi:AraC-like DNA-binding protein
MYILSNSNICKLVNRLNLEILTLGKAQVDAQWYGTVASPVYSRLYYIIDGSFSIRTPDNNIYQLEAGNWYLIPSGYNFEYNCSSTMEHFYFHIKLCDFDGTDLLRNCKKVLSLQVNQDVDIQLFTQCICNSDIVQGLQMRELVTGIILNFISKYDIQICAEDYSPCIYKALLYIKQNLSMQLTIQQIADNIFVSKSTLTKHFQKELHMSVNEYICNIIMAEAEYLLMTSNISIGELSHKLGYSDQLYFSRRFKDTFGISPREYRKQSHT